MTSIISLYAIIGICVYFYILAHAKKKISYLQVLVDLPLAMMFFPIILIARWIHKHSKFNNTY